MQGLFNGAFRGKLVFLTGHTGFKGSWLTLWLRKMGARVAGFALEPPTDPSLFELAQVESVLDGHRIGDVGTDAEALASHMERHRPDVVFHLAAQPLVRRSYAEPVGTFLTNVMGTINLLEAVRRCPAVKAVVVITTDKCYENREWAWGYRENDPLGGRDPYSGSKACAELAAASWRSSFFGTGRSGLHPARVATVRAGNVIGGGDWAEDRLLPDCVRDLAAGRSVAIRNPRSIRPWQHVLEPLSGYLLLASLILEGREDLAGAWNFGPAPGDHITVGEVADRVVSLWGSGRWEAGGGPQGPPEATWLKLDWTRAADILGWRPVWRVEQAIERTVAWYRSWHSAAADIPALCGDDLVRYTEDARRQGLPWAGGG